MMRTRTRTIIGLGLASVLVTACGAAADPQASATSDAMTPAAVVMTPAPAPTKVASAATMTPTPMAATDGAGDEVVRGTETLNSGTLATWYTKTTVNGVEQYRGGVAEFTDVMNDARVSGTARFAFSVDAYTAAASEWGPITITNDKGTWDGSCTGGAWAAGEAIRWSCWLAGDGAYKGYSYYRQVSKEQGDTEAQVIGMIYPGAIPKP